MILIVDGHCAVVNLLVAVDPMSSEHLAESVVGAIDVVIVIVVKRPAHGESSIEITRVVYDKANTLDHNCMGLLVDLPLVMLSSESLCRGNCPTLTYLLTNRIPTATKQVARLLTTSAAFSRSPSGL